MRNRLTSIALVLASVLPLPALAQSFPDTPLQVAASRPPANIMFILDDSGSMAFDYMPDTLASGDFNRKNNWINPLAYDPGRDYRPWRGANGQLLTGGTSFTSVYADDSRRSNTTDLRYDAYHYGIIFYYPRNPATLARGNTTRSNYYQYEIRYNSNGTMSMERCEYRSGNNWNRNCTTSSSAIPSGRSLSAELDNYATWYSYHRTRMKVAKAGVMEAFSQLPQTIRVGYDSIWNRSRMTVPVGTDNGLFRDSNKQTWFDRVEDANASGGTPLHGALARTGEYFRNTSSSGPWGPESGSNQFSCRQNFAILTTDGYWNNDDDYGSSVQVGNSDNSNGSTITSPKGETYRYTPRRPFMDTGVDTLADVAMEYWKTDLRSDLNNNVPASVDDPAFWQHMVTFGISIGLEGTLDPNVDLAALTSGSKSWPDPWRLSTNGSRSWSNESPRRIDDLWHATVNGRGKFSVANEPDEFARGMKSTLANIQKVLSSGSNVSTSSTSLQTDTRVFHATYYSGLWTGEVSAYDLSSSGIAQDPAWIGSEGIPSSGRKVFTASSQTAGTTFPTSTQSTALAEGLATLGMTGTGSDIAAYIKGTRSKEISFGGQFRNRESLLGDVVNSSPVYAVDSDTLYVGANDGMLHGFNATTGAELFAYVPRGLDFRKLGTLASPDYAHKFFVDGQVAVTSNKQTSGKNYLVAATGRGAKGVFGLDITNPSNFGNNSVLWDRTGASDNDMGYVLGEIIVTKTNSEDWVALVPNGIDSTSGRAFLFVYRLSDGAELARIDTGVAGGNGLSAPRGWDSDGNGTVDDVYAGDLRGNLWKFDLTSATPSQWKVAYSGQPLFRARDSAGNAQPITGGLALAREAFGDRRWILFGTGRYISQADITTTSVQSAYGIIDSGSTINNRNALTERDLASQGTGPGGNALRAFQTHGPLPAGSRGWFVDLDAPYAGERVIERGFVTGRVFVFPSVVPISGNACEASGRGFINAIDAFTGTSVAVDGVNHAYFDVGQDGNENNDWLGTGGNKLPVGSLETSIGMVTRPVLVGDRLVYGGSSGGKESQRVRLPPPSPKRLMWREVIRD